MICVTPGIGIGQFIVCTMTIVYYQNIIAWSIYYMGMSCSKILPWTTCDNQWNTPQCQDAGSSHANRSMLNYGLDNTTESFNNTVDLKTKLNSSMDFTFAHSDVEEFWQ